MNQSLEYEGVMSSENDLKGQMISDSSFKQNITKQMEVELEDVNALKDNILQYELEKNVVLKGFQKFFSHLKLLVHKNMSIAKRNYISTIFLYISALLTVLFVNHLQFIMTEARKALPTIDGIIQDVNNIQKCQPKQKMPSCITLGYAIIGEQEDWIEYAMQHVAYNNNLEYGVDVKQIVQGSPMDYDNYLKQNPGQVDVGVVFCNSEWPSQDNGLASVPCHFEQNKNEQLVFYTLSYNKTSDFVFRTFEDMSTAIKKQEQLMKIKVAIDNGIMDFFSKNQNIKNYDQPQFDPEYSQTLLDVNYQDYPINNKKEIHNIPSENGNFFFFMPFLLYYIYLVNDLLREKSQKLRLGVCVMGISHRAYWASWIVTSLIHNAVITNVLIFSARIIGFPTFTKTHYLILFMICILFSLCLTCMAFCIINLFQNPKKGYVNAYSILLIQMMMQIFLTDDWAINIYYSSQELSFTMQALFWVFFVMPSFHFSAIYSFISHQAGKRFALGKGLIEGDGFYFDKLFQKNEGYITSIQMEKIRYSSPSVYTFLLYLLFLSIGYYVLSWYFDHVVSGNRGSQDSYLFFLTPSYWRQHSILLRKKNYHQNEGDKKVLEFDYDNIQKLDTVKQEKERVLYNKMQHITTKGLRVINLSKQFDISSTFRSERLKTAFEEMYFELEEHELLTILGQNGAGKSTLINVLTGMLNPSKGNAEILEYDLLRDIEEIRTIMGICPQFDVLWGELTINEHLIMFSKVKGVKSKLINRQIDDILYQVDLLKFKHCQIKSLSGGQMRRVSLSIAAIGNPKIMFLDEPTTGMDPKTRRKVWEVIKGLKQNKSIIMTSHLMEEADYLSDRIAVQQNGRFKCIGTPLYLKNNYGDGYRLSLICNPVAQEIGKTLEIIKEILPSSRILDEKGGSIIVTIPITKMQELQIFFQIMEEQPGLPSNWLQLKNYVNDWCLSHCTLEEVFINVSKPGVNDFKQ